MRPSRAGRCPGACPFQFTHPGKGATAPAPPWWAEGVKFQFTHPGKGATVLTDTRRLADDVSIHAPWEGCDKLVGRTTLLRLSFNSRTLGRVRLSTRSLRAMFAIVSIHAPWEGCDSEFIFVWLRTFWFQFTHPGKGATKYLTSDHRGSSRFNSRTLGRVRLHIIQMLIFYICFNSRTLGRVRLDNAFFSPTGIKPFQFTHPGKGATNTHDK